ncbi:MAG: RNA polymerase sigma-70 factor [Chitinophagaceae bacterium]|nr:RNA polymerase sigma-70 factor [Chitinophagaceae bacterium]
MRESSTYEEKELLSLVAAGNQQAFASIYQQHWPGLYTYIMRTIRSEQDTEDIIQELFSSIWRRREKLAIKENLAAYLYSSARYMCVAFIEKNISQSRYLESFSSLYQQVVAPEAEMLLRIQEIEQQLQTTIEKLPPRMREIFILSRKEQLSQKEIAARLGISEETVKKQIQYALKQIRPDMELLLIYAVLVFSLK